jgi:hypothetical protein
VCVPCSAQPERLQVIFEFLVSNVSGQKRQIQLQIFALGEKERALMMLMKKKPLNTSCVVKWHAFCGLMPSKNHAKNLK